MRTIRLAMFGSLLVLIMTALSQAGSPSSLNPDSSKYYVKNWRTSAHNAFIVGFGVVMGSGYRDALQESHPDWQISGGSGWINVETGFAIKVSNSVSIVPKVSLQAMTIKFANNYGLPASSKAIGVVLPGIGAKYGFFKTNSTPYVSSEVSAVVPFSDIESPELTSGGVAIGAALGYTIDIDYEIELLYRYVPVKLNDNGEKKSNFGGIGIEFRRNITF